MSPNRPAYVVDTNVIVSALLLPGGIPRQALDAARADGDLLVSRALLLELDAVLRRPKFDRYLLPQERSRFFIALVRESRLVEVTAHVDACRDPKDNAILELAADGGATHIITGDSDLLTLGSFQGTAILTPERFLHYRAHLT